MGDVTKAATMLERLRSVLIFFTSLIKLGAILCAPLLVLAGIGWLIKLVIGPAPPQPPPLSYEQCVAERVAACVQESIDQDLDRSRRDLPVMPTRAEYWGQCRGLVVDNLRKWPGNECDHEAERKRKFDEAEQKRKLEQKSGR
jgi:hypothetical protein